MDVPASRRALLVVWGVLVLATILAWFVGADHGFGTGDAAVVVLLAITFAKVWLVGRWFMGLHGAPSVLRRVFDVYVGLVPAALIGLHLLA